MIVHLILKLLGVIETPLVNLLWPEIVRVVTAELRKLASGDVLALIIKLFHDVADALSQPVEAPPAPPSATMGLLLSAVAENPPEQAAVIATGVRIVPAHYDVPGGVRVTPSP